MLGIDFGARRRPARAGRASRTSRRSRSVRSALLLIGAAAIAAPAGAAEKITIGTAGATLLRLPLYVAFQKKFFEAEGLDPVVVAGRTGSDTIKMLVGGTVEFTTGQFIDSVNIQRQGIDVIGVALLTRRMSNAIVVRKALAGQIKSLKDLKGRTFGVTGIGSGTWQFALFIARSDGVKREALNFVGVGCCAGALGALKSGRVDVLSYGDPETYQLVADGDAAYLVDMNDDATHRRYIGDAYIGNQIMVLRSFAAKKPATVQKFVNAVQRAILWSQSAPVDELIKVLHGYEAFVRYDQRIFGGSIRKMMPAALPKSVVITPEAFENATKLSIAADAMKEPMPMARLVDNRFAEAAAKNVKPDTR